MNTQAAAAVAGVGAIIATGFLIYTLRHLDELRIPITHPRVLVEATIALGCAVTAVALLSR